VTLNLDDGEELILKALQAENRAMKRKEIEEASGLSRSKFFSGLKSLIAAGKVEVLGASVSTAYRVM
jgi:DNA-binding IclR family transcriptional regulator